MRQKLITLDPTSWDLAQKKTNFSQWVRDQLRSERNKQVTHVENYVQYKCNRCQGITYWHKDEKYPFCRATRDCNSDKGMELLG